MRGEGGVPPPRTDSDGREKRGVRNEYRFQIFTPFSSFSRHGSLSHVHNLPAFHLVFIIAFCFVLLFLPLGDGCWKSNHAGAGGRAGGGGDR